MSISRKITYQVGKTDYDSPDTFVGIIRQIRKDLGRNAIPESTIKSMIVAAFGLWGLGSLLRKYENFNIPRLGKFYLPATVKKKKMKEIKEKKKLKLEQTYKRLLKYQQKRMFLDRFDKINKRRKKNELEPLRLNDFIVWYKKIEWPKYSKKVRDKIKTDYNGRKWKKYVMFCRPLPEKRKRNSLK